jgi:cell division septum initiation protein DivIVA
MDEAAKLDRVIQDMLALAGGGTLSEQSKSSIQQAMSLVQKIKAAEEKESQDMLGGKISPGLMSKAYGGASA